jgi:1,4-alpha-glucan branching enzyme
MLSELEERKKLRWGDFLFELDPEIEEWQKANKTRKEALQDKRHLENLITRGYDIQEQLDEDWIDYGFMTFTQYMTQTKSYIHQQDIVMENIKEYLKNTIEYYKENKSGDVNGYFITIDRRI